MITTDKHQQSMMREMTKMPTRNWLKNDGIELYQKRKPPRENSCCVAAPITIMLAVAMYSSFSSSFISLAWFGFLFYLLLKEFVPPKLIHASSCLATSDNTQNATSP